MKKTPPWGDVLTLVTPTGNRWNTFIESLLILDTKLEKLGVESRKVSINVV